MNLELTHIQHYPLGGENALRVEYNGKVYKVTSLYEFSVEAYSVDSVKSILQPYEYIKPILRPMSDMFQDEELTDEFSDYELELLRSSLEIGEPPYKYVKGDVLLKLFANHYDVFSLIKQGLAIDINTIKE